MEPDPSRHGYPPSARDVGKRGSGTPVGSAQPKRSGLDITTCVATPASCPSAPAQNPHATATDVQRRGCRVVRGVGLVEVPERIRRLGDDVLPVLEAGDID